MAVAFVACVMSTLPALAQTQIVHGTPATGTDMDSAEGVYCVAPGTTLGGQPPYCYRSDGTRWVVLSFEGADRVAVDSAGRLWMARYQSATLQPGLFVEVDDQAVLAADLPPLPEGDFVDSLVLIGNPEMRSLPNGAVLPLRTPVVFSAQRRMFVHVWWTSAPDHHLNEFGLYAPTGATVPITPGWYEITSYAETSGSWFSVGIGTLSTTPGSGTPELFDDFATLGHSPSSQGRIATLLGFDARTYWMPAVRIPEPLDHLFRRHVITDSDAM